MAIVAEIKEKERGRDMWEEADHESQARTFYRFCSQGEVTHQSGTSLINRTAGSTRSAPLLQLLPFFFSKGFTLPCEMHVSADVAVPRLSGKVN